MAFNAFSSFTNIAESIKNLGATLGIYPQKTNALYPATELKDIQSKFHKENWCKLPFPYTFSVVGKDGNSTGDFNPFELPLAPQKIQQTEEFAISIKPTQGGTVVSHSGNKYKNLRIAGTTGIAPFKGAGGVDKSTGVAIFQPDQLKYHSGPEVFNELRNYFKCYYQFKKNHASEAMGKEARLLFKNYKDGEFLIVELISFDADRNAQKPHLYDYNLNFKVLGHFTFASKTLPFPLSLEETINNALAKIDHARGIFLRSRDIIKQIESTYENSILEPIRKVGLALRAAAGFGYSLADFPSNIVRSTVSTGTALAMMLKLRDQKKDNVNNPTGDTKSQILETADLPENIEDAVAKDGSAILLNLGEAATIIDSSDLPESAQTALNSEIDSAINLPKSFYTDTLDNVIRIKQDAEDAFNLGSDYYDTLFDRTKTITPDTTRTITDAEIEVLAAFNDTIDSLCDVMSATNFFKSDFDAQIQSIVSNFAPNELELKAENSAIQIILPAGMDLERLALKYLGDPQRWVEIAELNGLKNPFIVQDATDTTDYLAHPGSMILIPSPSFNGFSNLPQVSDIPSTAELSYLEKQYGTDLKLSKEFDLIMGNKGDLEVISGLENLVQATILKLGIERGELIAHPEIGVGVKIGSKVQNINDVKDNLIQSLLQDPRIERIGDISLIQSGSALSIGFTIYPKAYDLPIPLVIKV